MLTSRLRGWLDLAGIGSDVTLRWTDLLTHWPPGGLKALNKEEDVAVEAESKCTGPQREELQTLEDVRDSERLLWSFQ